MYREIYFAISNILFWTQMNADDADLRTIKIKIRVFRAQIFFTGDIYVAVLNTLHNKTRQTFTARRALYHSELVSNSPYAVYFVPQHIVPLWYAYAVLPENAR